MIREFVPFHEETIRKELDELPPKDAAKLASLMGHYEQCGLGNPSPVQIDDDGDGLYRLRHIKPAYQGRLLFFATSYVHPLVEGMFRGSIVQVEAIYIYVHSNQPCTNPNQRLDYLPRLLVHKRKVRRECCKTE
jgi:hypothetical protein